jgi:hypothetical protein
MRELEETGKAVSIPAEFVREISMPSFLKVLLGDADLQTKELRISSVPIAKALQVQMDVSCEDGERFVRSHLSLRIARGGTRQITLVNDGEYDPFDIELVLNRDPDTLHFSIRQRDTELNAVQYLELLKLFTCLSKSARIHLTNLQDGIVFLETDKTQGGVEQPDPQVVTLVSQLATIQRETKTPLMVPEREITREEARAIFLTYQAITTGRLELKWDRLPVTLQPNSEDLDALIRSFSDGKSDCITLEK